MRTCVVVLPRSVYNCRFRTYICTARPGTWRNRRERILSKWSSDRRRCWEQALQGLKGGIRMPLQGTQIHRCDNLRLWVRSRPSRQGSIFEVNDIVRSDRQAHFSTTSSLRRSAHALALSLMPSSPPPSSSSLLTVAVGDDGWWHRAPQKRATNPKTGVPGGVTQYDAGRENSRTKNPTYYRVVTARSQWRLSCSIQPPPVFCQHFPVTQVDDITFSENK